MEVVRSCVIVSHAVHFARYKAHHWIGIENPVLEIQLMSGMLVFDLDMVAIDWTATARCRCTFPHNTFIAIWRTPSERHRKSGPSSILNVGRSRLWV